MRTWALLAGVDAYEANSGITSLKYAGRDALETGRVLREVCGFDEVRVLAGHHAGSEGPATANAIFDRIEFAIADLRPDDLFVLGVFMHGVSRVVDGVRREFLLPQDARAEQVRTYVEQALIVKELERLRARRRVLLWDCCRDDPTAGRGGGANALATDVARDLSLAAPRAHGGAAASTCVLTACSPGGRAYESDRLGHGVFAWHLMRGIEEAARRQDAIDVRALGQYVEDEIGGNAAFRQQPRFRQEGAEPIVLAFRKASRSAAAEPAAPPPAIPPPPAPPPLRPAAAVAEPALAPIALDADLIPPIDLGAGEAGVPALDDAVRALQGRILGIERAIAGLEAGTHASLEPALRQVAAAAADHVRLEAERDAQWSRLVPGAEVPAALVARLRDDPAASLFDLAHDPALAPVADFTDRMALLQAIRNAHRGREAHATCVAAFAAARHDKVAALHADHARLVAELQDAVATWFATLAAARQDAGDAAFPIDRHIPLVRSAAAQLPSVGAERLWQIARAAWDDESLRRRIASTDARDAEAQVRLGDAQRARGGAGDAEAVRLYRAAAGRGHVGGTARLADMLVEGRGAPRDEAEAFRLYRAAAERGHVWAQLNAGFMAAHGLGVAPDAALALHHYRLAADGEDALARFLLARAREGGRAGPRNAGEALRLLRLAAGQGLAAAENEIGVLVRRGAVAAPDGIAARRWFEMAAARGLAVARVNLGLLDFAAGAHPDAAVHFRAAAEQGDGAGRNALGVMLADGLGVPRDAAEAERLFRLAQQQGVPQAATNLALLARQRRRADPAERLAGLAHGLPADEIEAMRDYRRAVERLLAGEVAQPAPSGPPSGPAFGPIALVRVWRRIPRWLKITAAVLAVLVGAALLDPQPGVPIDPAPARPPPRMASTCAGLVADDIASLRACAAGGDPVAQGLLGSRYMQGDGVARDDAEAERLLRLSAAQGFGFAQNALGSLYESGQGVEQSDARAARLYRMAADQGYAYAQINLAALYLDGRGVAADPVEGARLLQLAAGQNNPFAQCRLSALYREGRGVARDDAAADRLYALAAAGGMVSACPAR